ncbi:hypothetical protein LJ707_01585 [Mucilaginibacter sp. UR6-1]|uniref:tetratricopeptide repeat protein n=1 Tax=Mucilaginibacter sp. UR6-1 TaxID=1435643 RepID=UPI001E626A34|nr:hypothetical protein [Mucilaginibacter sp. UR6-1]MCC8407604.1 hypothetical protein [Mucilaginibacter sp. UR6-1]
MKQLTLFFLIAASNLCLGQKITYNEWKIKAKTEIRLLPEFGHAVKNSGQLAADKEFIETTLADQKNPRKASDASISRGFQYLYSGDPVTAMYRFNQAWLLDNKNENVYWGYAAVYFYFEDYNEALRQHETGLKINPKSANLLTDKGTVHFVLYTKSGNKAYFANAIKLLESSYRIDPSNQNTSYKLSILYFNKNDCINAVKYFKVCKELGGKPIEAAYEQALRSKCKLN